MITLTRVFNANGSNIFANKHKFLYGPILSTIIDISTDKQVYIFKGNNGYMGM